MPAIYFTQFMRPNGERKLITIVRPDNISKRADFIVGKGFRFECEVLTTGDASFTIADENRDYAIEVTANGAGVAEAVDKLISEFDVPAAIKRRNAENGKAH